MKDATNSKKIFIPVSGVASPQQTVVNGVLAHAQHLQSTQFFRPASNIHTLYYASDDLLYRNWHLNIIFYLKGPPDKKFINI